MTYLLDTNVCIKLLNNSSQLVVQKLAEQSPENINLCTVVAFELFYGAYRSEKSEKNLRKLEQFLNQFKVLDFDKNAAKICGCIRAELNKKGKPIGVYDLQIAAIALANNLILVTHNVAEFSRVEGLIYEDWEV
ncbi:MAG: type II toxin-antitoxin system VapC family toxin [Crinalium sp.]